ncbi:putative reverse transcriptase domain-containing protein [Tanacetum coccineum]
MPPKRASTSKAPAITQMPIKVRWQTAALLLRSKAQAATMASASNSNRNTNLTGIPPVKIGNYKEFISCQPFYFNGTKGAPIGIEQANQITWTELKRLLTNNYYPRTEIRKMEEELYNLIVKGNDLKPYVRRFQELTTLCPNMVPNTDKLLEAFIGGLPRSIEGNYRVTTKESLTTEELSTTAPAATTTIVKPTPKIVTTIINYNKTEGKKLVEPMVLLHQKIVGHLSKNCGSKKPATGCNQLPVTVVCHACGEKGHYTNQCRKTNINAQGRAYMLRDKNAPQDPNVVTVMEKKSDEKRLEDIPVVKDFPDVFPEDLPRLPPVRQVEFQIDLIPEQHL